ncbi:MAG: protein translocase subunit SecF [Clostridia bacterium]|nr:protein translocase subunit SecF [Clostridia bacterium]
MKKLKDLKLKIVEKFKYFAPISLAILLVGLILMLIPGVGMNVGIDFAGGAKVNVDFGEYLSNNPNLKTELIDEVSSVITGEGFSIGSTRWSGDSNTILEVGLEYEVGGKKVSSKSEDEQRAFLEKIEGTEENSYEDGLVYKIRQAVETYNAEFEGVEVSANIVNGSTSKKLLSNAIWATAVAVVIMLIYIGFRFTLTSGIAAVIALLHDVLVMIALTTIFQIQVNTTFIAAVITIVGYSINATIVIFDRIREVSKLDSMKDLSDSDIANKSIADTLGRSILTTLTTLAVIVVLAVVCAVMGITTMEEFALPIIFGLLAGTYSSVFLSASIWVYLRKLASKIKESAKKAKSAN